MWERRLLPLEEIKAFLLLPEVIRLQFERDLEIVAEKQVWLQASKYLSDLSRSGLSYLNNSCKN